MTYGCTHSEKTGLDKPHPNLTFERLTSTQQRIHSIDVRKADQGSCLSDSMTRIVMANVIRILSILHAEVGRLRRMRRSEC